MTKKATLSNEKQKTTLNKSFLRSGDGNKVEAVTLSQKMRYTKDEDKIRRFTLDEFLTSRHVQSFFYRMAAKLRNRQEEVLEEGTTAC